MLVEFNFVIVRFWGVRGTRPVPGPRTLRVGGNTACVSVHVPGLVLVLDAGTGIAQLGEWLRGRSETVVIMLTHPHSDHVQGMPFFAPLWEDGRAVHAQDLRLESGTHSVFDEIDGVHFPVALEALPAECRRHEGVDSLLAPHGVQVRSTAANHPGGVLGYRVETDSASFVYLTDHEIDAPAPRALEFDALVRFCAGADAVCHDAQYRADEAESHRGWGHSALPRVCDVAIAAGAAHLILFHHDPCRTDDDVAEMEREAAEKLAPHAIECTAAFEGLELTLGPSAGA